MKFDDFLELTQDLPIIESENFLAWFSTRNALEVQFSRWTDQRKLTQLRRGLYLLTPLYRKIEPYEFYLASVILKPSYVTLEKALEYHNLIPEAVPAYTCAGTKRAGRYETPLGTFDYRRIQPSLFWGYEAVTFRGQTGFVATREKALLDLFYLKHTGDSPEYLESLRLQNLDQLDLKRLLIYAERFGKPGIRRAAEGLRDYAIASRKREKSL